MPAEGRYLHWVFHSIGSYAGQIKPGLSRAMFAPARSRLFWLPVHLTYIGVAMLLIERGSMMWPLTGLLSLGIGASFAGLTFLAHETLHGAVVRGKRLRHIVGWLGFLPFAVSPRLWVAWHNRTHHARTNHPDLDPDAYPTLAAYRASRSLRIAIALGPGGGRWTLAIPLLIGFSVQSAHVLIRARRWGLLSARAFHYALAETALAVGIWAAVAASVGWSTFLLVFVIPLLVANSIVMAFILTNHSLNPLATTNDPLLNSLSVRLPRVAEWLTLGFGYHVEHHIFPAMSARHARSVRTALRARWPERYQSMPLARALVTIHRTGRVYKTDDTVLDPFSGREWTTLSPTLTGVGPTPR